MDDPIRVKAPEDENGWRNYADPQCEKCHGEGIITGMGSQSKIISPCRHCWPEGAPAWDYSE